MHPWSWPFIYFTCLFVLPFCQNKRLITDLLQDGASPLQPSGFPALHVKLVSLL